MGSDLPVAHERLTLTAFDGLSPSNDDFRFVLHPTGRACDWRLIEAASSTGLPFELKLGWSAGAAMATEARVTIGGFGRVCLLCRALKIEAANLVNETNTISVAVVDASLGTTNVWELCVACDGVSPVEISRPAWAHTAQIGLSDRSLIPDTTVSLFDAQLVLRAQHSLKWVPPMGLPLGATRKMQILTPEPARVRVLFSLSF